LLQELVSLFEKAYEVKGDSLILDSYKLKTGIYIKINREGKIDEQKIYDKKDEVYRDDTYRWFCKRDYLSDLLDMNKPIDPKKKVHSNNYLTLFFKKDIVIGDKKIDYSKLEERIVEYYDILLDPQKKYKKRKKSLELYNSITEPINEENIIWCKEYILKNLPTIIRNLKELKFDNYVKIFFDFPIEEYEIESKRYLVPNLFNANEYNKIINGEIYGLTNNNMGLNVKKPYLEHKTMVNNLPCLIKSSDILMHKKFFDWLGTRNRGCLYIKYESKFDIKKDVLEEIKQGKEGYYFLYIEQGKTAEIKNFDIIPMYNINVNIEIYNYLRAGYMTEEGWEEYPYLKKKTRTELEDYINEIWFDKRLKPNYYQDPKNIKKISQDLKNIIIIVRQAMFNYFKLSDDNSIKNIIHKYGLKLVTLQLRDNSRTKAIKAYNLYVALVSQIGGNEDMPGILNDTMDTLYSKIKESHADCDNDRQYYFLAGQVVSFLLHKTKAKDKNKKHDVVNAYLECNNDKKLKNEIKYSFMKYSHDIGINDIRFNNALSMIQMYEPENNKVDTQMFLAGYLAFNILYKKENE
jgi:CRISPR-associated protein Csh1